MLRLLIFTTAALLHFSCSNAQVKNKKTENTMSATNNNPAFSRNNQEKVEMKEEEWKKVLTPEQYYIARQITLNEQMNEWMNKIYPITIDN